MTCKILVGEDDLEDQFILEQAFKDNGYTSSIGFAQNGRKVIDYLNSLADDELFPKVIILDLNMPVLRGKDTLCELKNTHRYQMIPVIIYSTSSNLLERNECLKYGAVDYFVKPFSGIEMNKMVQRFLQFV